MPRPELPHDLVPLQVLLPICQSFEIGSSCSVAAPSDVYFVVRSTESVFVARPQHEKLRVFGAAEKQLALPGQVLLQGCGDATLGHE